MPDIGRNDPCSCGSGKKYKKCCGRGPAAGPLPDTGVWLQQARQYFESGAFTAALAAARQVLRAVPDNAEAHHVCGLVHFRLGQLDDALNCLETAIRYNPREPHLYSNTALVLQHLGRLPEAEDCCRKALALAPNSADSYNNLGQILIAAQRPEEAVIAQRHACELEPHNAIFLFNLGVALQARPDGLQEAERRYREALAVAPDLTAALVNLATLLMRQKRPSEAHPLALRLLRNSTTPDALLPFLMAIFADVLDHESLAQCWTRFRAWVPRGTVPANIMSDSLMLSCYLDSIPEEEVFRWHRMWGEKIEAQYAADFGSQCVKSRAAGSRIRIGYLSPDFCAHSVGFFIQHVIGNHDKSRFEVFCYSNSTFRDSVTEYIISNASHFSDIRALDDTELARKIDADGIDILVDLAGHTHGSRIEVLAHRPAPLQMTWIGYLASTGLQAMDYRITDPYADPDTPLGTEKLLRLPECFLCFGSFPDPGIDPIPAFRRNGKITFASFNNFAKIGPAALALWARVLARTPGSTLLIAARAADSQLVQQHVLREFARHGIGPDRIQFQGRLPREDYFRLHNEVDIVLDTFPFNGGTITCGALWMGVPVVTFAGETQRQRMSYSFLKNIGVEDTVTRSALEYVETAVALAASPERLTVLRHEIAAGVRASILCQPQRFTRQYEEALLRAGVGSGRS